MNAIINQPKASPSVSEDLSIAVIYLARGEDAGPESAERFFQSYDEHPAGLDHELVVLVKGWELTPGLERVTAMARDRSAHIVELPDDGFDLGAYFRVARKLKNEWCCFFNSHAHFLHDNWLKIMYEVASRPGVGVVSCSGNCGTTSDFLCREIFTALKKGHLGEAIKYFRHTCTVIKDYWPYIPAFPNPHLRTNAFLVRRSLWLDFYAQTTVPQDKRECFILEHGRSGFTRFIRSKGLQPLIVGLNGKTYSPERSLESGTFMVPGLPNLLIGDNHSVIYLAGTAEYRAMRERQSWGKVITVLPEEKDGWQARFSPPVLAERTYRECRRFWLRLLRRFFS